jgi:hypothetical protein
MYQEFPARTHLFTRESVDDPTQQVVVAPGPWPVQLWLVDVGCLFYDLAPNAIYIEPSSVLVPRDEPITTITTLRFFSPDASDMLPDLTEARPSIRKELNVKTFDGG